MVMAGAVLLLLTGCAASGSPTPSPTPAPTSSAGSTSTSTPGGTGATPNADQVTWAGNVCSDTTALQNEVQALAAVAAAGGSGVGQAISDQVTQISASVGTLVETVKSAPTGTGDDPGYAAVRSSTDKVDQSLQKLQASASQVEGATGAALITALGTVVVDTGTVLTDIAATVTAISTAMKDASSTLGQSFRAAPECATLTAP